MKEYRRAYEKAAKELETAIAERKRVDGRIMSLRKTLNVLSGLLEDDKAWLAKTGVLDAQQESLTDDIALAIAQAKEPLTSTEIKDEVKKFSQAIAHHKNALATVNAVVKRLVKHGTIEEVKKNGRKAWRAKGVSLLSMMNQEGFVEGQRRPAQPRVAPGQRRYS